ncbi:glycerophosphodiester phosphodiesterase family protein [Bacillus sp. N9]
MAHRGSSAYAPENTMSAFRLGVEHGVDFIECDVHLSKDGKLIIIHDEKVDRTTDGFGYVKDFTLEELKQLDAGVSLIVLLQENKLLR